MEEAHDILKNQIIALVKEIQQEEARFICEMTETFLYNLFVVYKENLATSEILDYVSVLYRLIFHTHQKVPELSYQLIKGFMNFGQSRDGANYKPMLDHYFMETFDGLVYTYGWSFLKKFTTLLRDNLENEQNEPIFHYLILQIVNQLKLDDIENQSDLCYNLPREKSFSWGWLSYYIAHMYGAHPPNLHTPVNAKNLRKYMMNYRHLLTRLRRSVMTYADNTMPYVDNTMPYVDENDWWTSAEEEEISWTTILTILNQPKYAWAKEVIITTEEPAPAPAPAQEAPAPAPTEEAPAQEAHTPAQEAPAQEAPAQEAPAQTQTQTEEKISSQTYGFGSWLYSWFNKSS